MDRTEIGRKGYASALPKLERRYGQRRADAIKRFTALDKHCPVCGKAISFENRRNTYCNHSCAAIANNSRGRTKAMSATPHPCVRCATMTTNAKYCSRDCATRQRRDETWESVERGEYHSVQGTAVKKHLLEKRGARCEICGITEWMGRPINLVMDHIDGNSENWSPRNLRLICPNCDSYNPTFGARNVGNGRKYRRKNRV